MNIRDQTEYFLRYSASNYGDSQWHFVLVDLSSENKAHFFGGTWLEIKWHFFWGSFLRMQ
jgi:hypothetical protein